jgi:hypothetical protein
MTATQQDAAVTAQQRAALTVPFSTRDAAEGFAAFTDRSSPEFEGR